jgi:peptidoglycan/xylan/chitin deacetylase (PgdA/CDA1 family)
MRYDYQFLQILFPIIISKTNVNGIHLTFDDGPNPNATPQVLNFLRERNILAHFFVIGENAQKYPDIVRKIKDEGHLIGNHTNSHTCLLFKSYNFVQREILLAEEAIENAIGKRSKFFRPPYGYFDWTTIKAARKHGYSFTLWSSDSKDYRIDSPEKIKHRIISQTINGAILLFHDNYLTEARISYYLPKVLDSLLEKGFIFLPLPL